MSRDRYAPGNAHALASLPPDLAFADTVTAFDDEPTPPLPTSPLTPAPVASAVAMVGNHPLGPDEITPPLPEASYAPYPPPYERPRAFTGPPPPLPDPNAGLVTRSRHAFSRASGEMRELWTATSYDDRLETSGGPFARLGRQLRRVRTMFGFFEWDHTDIARAAWIGVAVFVVVAAIGAFALHR